MFVLDDTVSKSSYIGPSYYSRPEQLKKEKCGKEVDIYALSIIFFEMNYPFSTEKEWLQVNI